MMGLDVMAMVVYVDLYMVKKFERHIITPNVMNKAALKNSLKRNWFCVLDKVQVSDLLTILDVLFIQSSFSFIISYLDFMDISYWIFHSTTSRGITYCSLRFHLHLITYLMTLMFSIMGYTHFKFEVCFHCKIGFFILQTLSLILSLAMMDYFPWTALGISLALLGTIGFLRK